MGLFLLIAGKFGCAADTRGFRENGSKSEVRLEKKKV